MPLSMTADQWLQGTAVTGRVRSIALRRLDAAIAEYSRTRDEQPVLRAFRAWIADGHEAWRTNARNRTGMLQRLYNDVGLGLAFLNFMNQMIDITCRCRAGGRLMWVIEYKNNQSVPTAPAKVWIDSGRMHLVEADMLSVSQFYSIMRALRDQVQTGVAPPDVARVLNSRRPQTEFGTNLTFAGWATAAEGNCAQAGSRDATHWVKLICDKTGFDYSTFRARFQAAEALGKTEEQGNADAGFLLLNRAELRLPAPGMLSRDVKLYMTEIIRINQSQVAFAVLRREYNKAREDVLRDIYFGDPDDDLLTFEQAVQEARLVRR